MAKLRSALESFRAKMDEDDAGTEVNITVVVDAEAEAVEEALEEQEVQGEAAEAEALADANEAAEEEAAELVAIAGVLRNYGLTPGMSALLKASGMEARYGIRMPAMESLDTTGRNQGKADAIAAAFEAAGDSFWQKTKNFMMEMWDKVKRFFTWISTKIGGLDGRVKRAFKALEGKAWDPEKGKNAGKYRRFENLDKQVKAIEEVFDMIDEFAKKNTGISKFVEDATAEKGMYGGGTPDEIKKVFVDMRPDEAKLKLGFGYKYDNKDGDSPFRIEEDDKDFLKGKEVEMDEKAFQELQTGGHMAAKLLLTSLDQFKAVAKACEDSKKSSVKLLDKMSDRLGNKAINNAIASNMKALVSFWLKVTNRGVKFVTTAIKQLIVAATRARACTKVGV